MEHKYRIVIEPLSEEDGGGYLVKVPDLPGCMTDGETIEEALSKVQDAIDTWIMAERKMGRSIPCPSFHQSEQDYSGKVSLRIPKQLHRELAKQATNEGVSLNSLMIYYLSKGIGYDTKYSNLKQTMVPRTPQERRK